MTDEVVRTYARRAITECDPGLERRHWLELVRRGRLPPFARGLIERLLRGEVARDRLRLAAFAGDSAALALVEDEITELIATLDDELGVRCVVHSDGVSWSMLRAWLAGLERFGPAPWHVAQIALARRLVATGRVEGGARVYEALDAAARFVTKRNDDDLAVVLDVLPRHRHVTSDLSDGPAIVSAALVHALARAVDDDSDSGTWPGSLLYACEWFAGPSAEAARNAKRAVTNFALG